MKNLIDVVKKFWQKIYMNSVGGEEFWRFFGRKLRGVSCGRWK
jgi:hypothetical protein